MASVDVPAADDVRSVSRQLKDVTLQPHAEGNAGGASSEGDEEAVQREVAAQLQAVMDTLPPFRQMLVQEQMDAKPSRLHASLCEYVRQVAAVKAHAQAAGTDSITPAASPALSHPTFSAALQFHLLSLLEERWESVFASVGGTGYSCNDGKRISKAERAAKGLETSSLVYGEVNFRTLGEILWGPHCASLPAQGGCFVDLGSGTGRGVLAAASLAPFARLRGVEILEGLHGAALDVARHYEEHVRPSYRRAEGDPRATAQIELICGSFLDVDWAPEADLVFMNSTCYGEELIDAISVQGQKLRDGAVVIAMSQPLTGPYYTLVYSKSHPMSQGNATVNVMIKRTPEASEVAKLLEQQRVERERQRQREEGLD